LKNLRAILASLCVMLGSLAIQATGSVSITVRDAKTGGPVQAAILLEGPVTVGDSSDIDGKVTFGSLAPGRYTMTLRRSGYALIKRSFSIDPDSSTAVEVLMAPLSGPKEIASVIVRPNIVSGRYTVDSTSTISSLSPSLSDSLRDIAGLNLSSGNGSGQPQTISILGHDPTETGVSLGGIPLNVPGTAFNLASLDTDVLAGLGVEYGPSGNASAGSVTLKLLEPTIPWQTGIDVDAASYQRSFWALSEQGTTGHLSVSYKQAFRADTSPLDGDVFPDASGLDYAHSGVNDSRGMALKAVYSFSSKDAFTLTSIDSSSYSDALCTVFTNPLPCGYGPGNFTTGSFHLFDASDQIAIGSGTVTASAYGFDSATNGNFSNQIFDTIRVPLSSAGDGRTQGFSLLGETPLGTRDSLTAQGSVTMLSTTANASGPTFSQQTSQTLHYTTLSLKDKHKASSRLQFVGSVQSTSLTSTHGALSAQGTALIANSPSQTTTFSAFAGSGIHADGSTVLLSDPGQLQYDCAAQTAAGSAPGSPIGTDTVASISAAWSARLPKGAVSIDAYAQTEQHTSLTALVNALAFPASSLPAGYFAAAQTFYQLGTNCGAGTVLPPKGVFLATTVSDVNLIFQGATAQVHLPLGRQVEMQASVALNRVVGWSSDPLLSYPLSIFQSGRQLEGQPFASGYLSVAYKPPLSTLPEIFLGERYSGYGNSSFLPPNVVTDFAVVQHLERGVVSVLVNNVFDTHAGNFQTAANAVPLVSNSGIPIGGTANPNQPRQVTASYTVAVGKDANADSAVEQSFDSPSASGSLIPGYLVVEWPTTRPTNPFRRNSGTACTAKKNALADPIFSALQTVVSDIETAKKGGAYPSTLPSQIPPIPGVALTYQLVGAQYALTLLTTKVDVTDAMLSCGYIHVGAQGNASAANLPYPAKQSLTSVAFYYTPDVGIYFIQVPPESGQGQKFRTYQVPSSAPANPFQLASGTNCETDLQPIASKLLRQLTSFFARPNPDSGATADWQIVRHQTKTHVWYELDSGEIGAVTSLINCGHVSSAARSALQAIDLDGTPQPNFNYAPEIGLYILSR
jgi:hypothetical protein